MQDSLSATRPPALGTALGRQLPNSPEKDEIVVRSLSREQHRSVADGTGKLVVVSNREPFFRDEAGNWQRTAGGLVSALEPVMSRQGGSWLAWNPGAERGEENVVELPVDQPSFTLHRVPVTADEVTGFYDGFANRALWPLCHYAFETCHFDRAHWAAYARVNARFARHVVRVAAGSGLVWIHDYHFFLLPELVRKLGVSTPVAFFLHIPFPNPECFAICPWRHELLEGLLGADLIGFHTRGYQRNFLRSVRQLLGATIDETRGRIVWQGRRIRTGAFPIGVDFRALRRLGKSPEVALDAAHIREAHGGRRLILGVDRLDYSKGILEKLAAVELLLATHREYRKQVEFVQITVPSRTDVVDYQQLKRQIDEEVGRINGRFGADGWVPIHHLYRYLPLEQLAGYYAAADVALVAPRRDGMNLVSKEYVACRARGDGALVLSEFAGSAAELACGALLVNPFDTATMASAVHAALAMPAAERVRRMRAMRKVVADYDVHDWVGDILGSVRPDRRDVVAAPTAHSAVTTV